MNIGTEQLRNRLRLTVHRGGVGQRPNRLSATHAVAADETILSGMLMTLIRNTVTGRLEWIKGVSGSSLPNQFFFALDDSTDGDVKAAGNLQGLSVHGDYELSTAQYKTGVTYNQGTLLTPEAATGLVRPVVLAGQTQDVGVPVVGVVVKDYAPPVNLAPGFVAGSLLPEEGGAITPGVQGGTFVLGRATNATNLERIRFETVQPWIYNPA